MAVISTLYVLYLIISQRYDEFDAPLTIYLFIIMSFAITGIVGDLLKEVLLRPRPIESFAGQIIALSDATSSAIPSGHATKSVALILPFLLLVSNRSNWHKIIKLILILLGLGVAFSRVVLGAHYLSDVIAGIGMAFIGLPFTMLFCKMILRQSTVEKLPMMSKIWGFILVAMAIIFSLL
jgi:undecaprenyl-diphosphatase